MYEKGQGVKQDYTEALSWYLKAAVRGDFKAKLSLHKLYWRGLGVKEALARALSLVREANSRENLLHNKVSGLDTTTP